MKIPRFLSVALLFVGALSAHAASAVDLSALLKQNDVIWDTPGSSSADSMPLGNGDIGLNVWTESNGDVVFYIGKTDAWTENPKGTSGLAKVGKVRVSTTPALFSGTNGFSQTLHLYNGEIVIKGENGQLRLWVDANSPVIHLQSESKEATMLKVSLDPYRNAVAAPLTNAPSNSLSQFMISTQDEVKPDFHVEGLKDGLAWCHFNGMTNGRGRATTPEVANWGFGALIQGKEMTASGTGMLTSPLGTNHEISITVASGNATSDKEWIEQFLHASSATYQASDEKQLQAHRDWWHAFWDRSYLFVEGVPEAKKVTQGYTLQRFVTACAGRGAYPIKFNGSIFVIDWPAESFGKDKATGIETIKPVTADYRSWGGQYWFQNTRAMYWPRLMAGDYDLMQPLFKMYLAEIRNNEATVKKLYNHDGSYIAETSPHWGALPNLVGKKDGKYTDYYFTPVLECSTMMMDYYDHTQDKAFARETLLPFANLGLTFFKNHFPRDKEGKLLLSPDNSIEMYWMVANPLPDIAGLHYLISRLKTLPDDVTTVEMRREWADLEAILPPISVADKDGKKVIYPYDPALNTGVQAHNFENPELYAVYPFRLYGLPELGKADLQTARDTYAVRTQKGLHCWGQDPMDCAFLGQTEEAKKLVIHDLTNQDKRQRFFAFWDRGHDYAPDEDIGGNGEQTLQLMLMQCEGKKILLLPAWPKDWNCTFKLHAPFKTTVSGRVENGKIQDLVVDPESRKADVIIAGGQQVPKR